MTQWIDSLAELIDQGKASILVTIVDVKGSVPRGSGTKMIVTNQGLHQGASLSLDAEKNVADVFYQPLLLAIAGFVLLFVSLVLLRTRTEIRLRQLRALELRARRA